MRKTIAAIITMILLLPALAACGDRAVVTTFPTTGAKIDIAAGTTAPTASGIAGMPARPGSGATGDPSGHLIDLVDISGTAKEVKEGFVLLTNVEGGEYMLRFSENTKWADGVSQEIKAGNKLACRVKPEPTFTTPSQGEVFLVTCNEP